LDFAQFALNQVIGLVVFALVLSGVFKVFQIKSELTEIKELLADIKRNTQDHQPADYAATGSTGYREPDLSILNDPAYGPEARTSD